MLIGQLSARVGISVRMLRHYDSIGLVTPTHRTPAGYREYADTDVRRLFHVECLRSLGLSLAEIAGALADLGFDPTRTLEALVERTRERIASEQDLLRRLERVQTGDPSAWSDVLRTIAMIRTLRVGDSAARQRLALSLDDDQLVDAEPIVEAMLSEPDANAASALIWALARIGDSAIGSLVAALDSPNATRRARAAEALTKLGTPAASDALAELHHDPDPAVRVAAVLERGRLGQRDAIPSLVKLIVEGDHDVDAADTLALLADQPDAGAEIGSAISDAVRTGSVEARRRLTESLAEIPGDRAHALLSELATDPDRQTALTASVLLLHHEKASGAQPGDGDPRTAR